MHACIYQPHNTSYCAAITGVKNDRRINVAPPGFTALNHRLCKHNADAIRQLATGIQISGVLMKEVTSITDSRMSYMWTSMDGRRPMSGVNHCDASGESTT